MSIHPLGMAQAACTAWVALATSNGVWVGAAVGIFCVGNGEANSTAKVVGMGDGVGGKDAPDVSVNDSEMPPITSNREMAPMINPLPIWRRAFMFISPFLLFSRRGAAAR